MVAPVVRAALRQSMQMLGHAFIVGETITAALARAEREPELALCSFDVLGEGARTEADARALLRSLRAGHRHPRAASLRQRPTRARASR